MRVKRLAMIAAGIALCAFVTQPLLPKAATSDEIREEIEHLEAENDRLEQQIQQWEGLIKDNLSQMSEIVRQKQIVDQQIFALQESLQNSNEQIAAFALLIADKQEEIDEAEERLTQLNIKHKERIRAMEESGKITYWRILFEARSLSDLLDRLEITRQIAASDRRRLSEIRKAALDLNEAKEALSSEKVLLESARMELLEKQAELEQKRERSDSLLQQLAAKGQEYEQLLERGEAEQDQLMQEIAKQESAFDEAKYQEWLEYQAWLESQKPAEPEDKPPVSGSGWITPVPYYTLTSPFGNRLHPVLGIYRMHQGVDLACAQGTEIYASRGGLVTIAQWSDSAGWYVQIDHGDGFRSVYMHMTHYIVSAGEYVAPGQVIGYVGNTGLSKGAHLHFGISYNGEYVNPMEYIN